MAYARLHISHEFFNHVTAESRALHISIQELDAIVLRAAAKGEVLRGGKTLLSLKRVMGLVEHANRVNKHLEELLAMCVVKA